MSGFLQRLIVRAATAATAPGDAIRPRPRSRFERGGHATVAPQDAPAGPAEKMASATESFADPSLAPTERDAAERPLRHAVAEGQPHEAEARAWTQPARTGVASDAPHAGAAAAARVRTLATPRARRERGSSEVPSRPAPDRASTDDAIAAPGDEAEASDAVARVAAPANARSAPRGKTPAVRGANIPAPSSSAALVRPVIGGTERATTSASAQGDRAREAGPAPGALVARMAQPAPRESLPALRGLTPAGSPAREPESVHALRPQAGRDAPPTFGSEEADREAPAVHVTIDRIEVHAASPPQRAVRDATAPRRPALSLDAYLRQRNEPAR